MLTSAPGALFKHTKLGNYLLKKSNSSISKALNSQLFIFFFYYFRPLKSASGALVNIFQTINSPTCLIHELAMYSWSKCGDVERVLHDQDIWSKTVSVHLAKSQENREINTHTSLSVFQWWFPSLFTRVSLRFNSGSLYQLLEQSLCSMRSESTCENKLFWARWITNRKWRIETREIMNGELLLIHTTTYLQHMWEYIYTTRCCNKLL